jgi:hypothetical protein
MSTGRHLLQNPGRCVGSEPIAKASIQTGNGNAKKDFLDITALIRSVQRAEGNPDCFLKGYDNCDQPDCAWRLYCLGSGKRSGEGKT